MLHRLLDVFPANEPSTLVRQHSHRPFVSKHSHCTAFRAGTEAGLGSLQSVKDDSSDQSEKTKSCLQRLLLPDTFDGRRVVELSTSGVEVTAPIPSAHRIAALLLREGEDDLFVADSDGLVVRRVQGNADPHAAARAATRPESDGESVSRTAWDVVAKPSSTVPERGGFPCFGTAGGWVGLAHSRHDRSLLLCSREYYSDIRLLDVPTGQVRRTLHTQHMPTAVAASDIHGHTFFVAEGPLVSLYDVRTAATPSLYTSLRGVTVSSLCAIPDKPQDTVALCSTDRSVAVMDTRKWTKVFSVQNVLKYDVQHVCPIQRGAFLVCSGRDSEVRVIGLERGEAVTPPAATAEEATTTGADGATFSSFRSRLQDTAQCATVWHGAGWVSDGTVAVGLSQGNELYFAS